MTTRSTHPGAILREDVLPALFAEQTGIDVETLQEILAERADVTPEIAEKLGKRLGNGRELWLAERLRCSAKAQARRAQATAALKVKVHPRAEKITPESALLQGVKIAEADLKEMWVLLEGVVPGLKDVQEALPTRNPWAVLNFLVRADDRLDGRKPIEVLLNGDVDLVVSAARSMGEQGE